MLYFFFKILLKFEELEESEKQKSKTKKPKIEIKRIEVKMCFYPFSLARFIEEKETENCNEIFIIGRPPTHTEQLFDSFIFVRCDNRFQVQIYL